MNPLLKKEIRLLLPSWSAILALEVLLPCFWRDADLAFTFTPFFIFLGIILLAVDSFGRECSLGTFQSLLAQPMERREIWRAKISVLFLAAVLILAAYFVSCDLRLHLALTDSDSIWHVNPKLLQTDFQNGMLGSVVAVLVALVGGLWTALLFRQAATAFWISFLVPAGVLLLIALVMSKFFNSASDVVVFSVLYSAAGIYTVAGFWLAHRMFHRAQDAAWTGGIISFSKWRYYDAGSNSSISTRHRKPFAALLKKEFQLQSVSLICAGALLAVHLAVIVMRKAHGHFEPKSVAGTVSEFYWALWLVMSLLIGCTVVAEEQRLGVMEGQFCLPASRRLQFALKFFLTIVSGLLLGGFMPLLLEGLAAMLGAPNPDIRFLNSPDGSGSVSFITVISLALGLSLVGTFASTFTKNILQAMGIAIATIIGCVLLTVFAWNLNSVTWNHNLTIDIEILTALVMVPTLTYRNFKYFQERGRMWRRNVWGLTGAILFVFISSAALHNRVWEVFEPAEPSHGPANFSLANPPVFLKAPRNNLLVRLPDGRVWFDSLDYHGIGNRENRWIADLQWAITPLRKSAGPQHFLSGSNWVSVVAGHEYTMVRETSSQGYSFVFGYLESVGIQPDGTLWVSGKSDQFVWTGDNLSQFGNGTNWQQVAGDYRPTSVLLLKNDGTLWLWGTNHFDWNNWPQKWPGLRAFQPYQIGTNSDWREICSLDALDGYLAKNASGGVWRVWGNNETGKDELIRATNYDAIPFVNTSKADAGDFGAYMRKDGTPWIFYETRDYGQGEYYIKTLQSSKETDWVSVAVAWDWMVALKSDGTLWKWDWRHHSYEVDFAAPPTRLGIHNDWVAIVGIDNGVVALAADGSLWLWPNRGNFEYERILLKLPKQPQYLGNIFGKSD